MNRGFAQFISYVFHPGLMPLGGVAVIMLLSPHFVNQDVFLLVLGYAFLGTYLFPFMLSLLLLRLKLLSNLEMYHAKERRLPYIAAALFYFLTARSMSQFPVPDYAAKILLAGVFIMGLAFALLPFIKLSMHMAGVAALLALIIQLSVVYKMQLLLPLALLIFLSGLMGTARLVLKAHTPTEVYLGFALGLGSAFLSLNV